MTPEETRKYLKREKIFLQINKERKRQDELHAPKTNNFERLVVLMEECCEVAMSINDGNHEFLYEELVQVAAYAIRFIEEIEGENN